MGMQYYSEGVEELAKEIGFEGGLDILIESYESLDRYHQRILHSFYGIEDYSSLDTGDLKRIAFTPEEVGKRFATTEKNVERLRRNALEKLSESLKIPVSRA